MVIKIQYLWADFHSFLKNSRMHSVLFVMDNQGLELMLMVKELSCSITSQVADSTVPIKAMLICKILLACGTSNHDKKKKKYPPHWWSHRRSSSQAGKANNRSSIMIDNRTHVGI